MAQPQANLFSAWGDALADGFNLDFALNVQGDLYCLHKEVFNPRVLQVISCLVHRASLYLISADNGAGTMIEYWEN